MNHKIMQNRYIYIYISLVLCLLTLKICFLSLFVSDIQYTVYFLFEIGVLLCVSTLGSSFLFKLLLAPLICIEAAQYVSLYSTGNYIIPLTLLNLQNAHDINNEIKNIISISCAYILIFYVNMFLLHKVRIFLKKAILAFPIYIIAIITSFIIYNAQLTWKKYPFPLENISYISYKAIKIVLSTPTDTHSKLFERKSIHTNFKKKVTVKDYKNFNVVVIFLEGTSSTVLSEELTPHIKRLQKKSINIINYFNHTAATFRGLRGQFISGYSLKGGREYAGDLTGVAGFANTWKGNTAPLIESLPYILEKNGYSSIFISPHNKSDRLASVMAEVGFQRVLTAENFGKEFTHFLTDKQAYQFLWHELLNLKSSEKPFFLCMYQLGTHHGLDSPDKKFGDGKNTYLNKFYNADFWLGNFVDKFLSDSISYNTILIITSDHATFSVPEYRKVFNVKNQYFIDEIPFLIFIKDIPGQTVDAQYRNSLSFAPTVLDILGIDKVKNHFLGDSIFYDQQDTIFSHISCLGDQCYQTGRSGVRIIDEEGAFREVLDLIKKYYTVSG